jgi:hypothetical protein
MDADVPEPPDGWTVSTATPTHLALYHAGGDGRSLVIVPSEPQASDAWTVKGLAGYGPEYPVYADEVAQEAALEEARSIMEAIASGETPTPLRTESLGTSGVSGESEDSHESERDQGDTGERSTDEGDPDQADLMTFAGQEST